MEQKPPSAEQRLEKLNQRLEAFSTVESSRVRGASSQDAKAAIDFASASATGTFLGYLLDGWQGTSPWGMVIGLVVGVAAGLKLMLVSLARERSVSASREAEKNE